MKEIHLEDVFTCFAEPIEGQMCVASFLNDSLSRG